MTATDCVSNSTDAIATLNAELILLKTRVQSLERLLLEKHLDRAKNRRIFGHAHACVYDLV